MKLTKEQSQEIKDQQSQQNKTKRVTAPALENILYEAEVLTKLDHRYILNFQGFYNEKDYMFLATDWMSMDLFDFMNWNYNKLTEQVIRGIFKMSALGVAYLHS